MSPPHLCALALALLLQACTTTGPQRAQVDSEAAAPPQARHEVATPTAAIAPLPVIPPFDGPQVIFPPGSADIPRTAAPVLDDVAAKLKADPLVSVVLVGHTEDLGSMEFSVAVASKCAQAVGQALIKRGARPSQIRMMPRGHQKTAAKRCTSAACKKQMRRVDIVMSSY